MSAWQPIDTAPKEIWDILLWCPEKRINHRTKDETPIGFVTGRIVDGHAYGDGMSGDWVFSHWMQVFSPEASQ